MCTRYHWHRLYWFCYLSMFTQSPSEMPGSPKVLNSLFPAELEGQKRVKRRVSEMYWGRPGWTGTKYTGRSVGCPELPDGSM